MKFKFVQGTAFSGVVVSTMDSGSGGPRQVIKLSVFSGVCDKSLCLTQFNFLSFLVQGLVKINETCRYFPIKKHPFHTYTLPYKTEMSEAYHDETGGMRKKRRR